MASSEDTGTSDDSPPDDETSDEAAGGAAEETGGALDGVWLELGRDDDEAAPDEEGVLLGL